MADKITLDDPRRCLTELERCSTGLATLTQEATRNREALGVMEDQLDIIESVAARAVRDGDTKLTATEVKGRITEFIEDDERLANIKTVVNELRAEKDTLDRRLRTLERRSSNAQSALNAHKQEHQFAGFQGGSGV